jgi:hypothetical protein
VWTLKGLEKVSFEGALNFYHDLAKRNDHEMDNDLAKNIAMSVIETMKELKINKYDSCLILKNAILVIAMTEAQAVLKNKIDNEEKRMRKEMK